MLRPGVRALLLILLTLLAAPSAPAIEITLFLSRPAPTEVWKTGVGAAITSTWFHLLDLEGEAAKQPLESGDGSLVSFSASALLAPPVGRFTPYGGLGVGLFRQTLVGSSDTGTLHCLVLGVKVKLGLLVLKGDFRDYSQSGTPLALLDKRFSFGGGVSF